MINKTQILVPVYNEGENARRLYERFKEAQVDFDSMTFVYDFAGDTTVPVAQELQKLDSRIQLEKNDFGRGALNALKWGFSKSQPGPVIVVMGDCSDKLAVIPEMVKLWNEGATLVSASRYMPGGKQHGGPWLKGLMSRVAGVSLKLFGFPTSDPTNNFKLYDGAWLRSQTLESQGGFEVAIELCYLAYAQGKTIKEVPSEWYDRTDGQSNFKLWKWLPHYLKFYCKILKQIFLT
ncbi:glycosyltransferase [bacterium]|nr:glycosyltransferase [bacterium]